MNQNDTPGAAKSAAAEFRVLSETSSARYLELSGWSYTNNTPGSYWYWQKTLPDGRTVLTNKEGAMQMQEYLDGQ